VVFTENLVFFCYFPVSPPKCTNNPNAKICLSKVVYSIRSKFEMLRYLLIENKRKRASINYFQQTIETTGVRGINE
jgi:hypothetical protein